MGIPAAVQAKIFDLYFTTKPSGSGIGLPMAYRIMQLHQGSIDFESAENTGTVFRLQFPLAVPLPSEKEAAEVRTS
jgi:signal transduction histidine kinase